MEKKPILKLRVFRGKELNYDENRNIKNENNLISVEHNSKMWTIMMKNLPLSGYAKVTVESGFKVVKDGYEPIADLSDYEKEVQEAFNPKKVSNLTNDQKRIAELEARLEAFMSGKETKKAEKVEKAKEAKKVSKDERSLRDIYIDEVGKNPFNGWSEDEMMAKLKEFRASKK